jgi:hypothetical protein
MLTLKKVLNRTLKVVLKIFFSVNYGPKRIHKMDPRTLAQNCGANVIRTMTMLSAKHAEAHSTFGINGLTGKVGVAFSKNYPRIPMYTYVYLCIPRRDSNSDLLFLRRMRPLCTATRAFLFPFFCCHHFLDRKSHKRGTTIRTDLATWAFLALTFLGLLTKDGPKPAKGVLRPVREA